MLKEAAPLFLLVWDWIGAFKRNFIRSYKVSFGALPKEEGEGIDGGRQNWQGKAGTATKKSLEPRSTGLCTCLVDLAPMFGLHKVS